MDASKRWELAKKMRLCFRCLDGRHLGQYFTRTRVCGLNSCKSYTTDCYTQTSHTYLMEETRQPPLRVQA